MRAILRFLAVVMVSWPLIAVGGGPNDGGTLILHANSSLVYTIDQSSWCGQTGLSACSLATVTLPLDPAAVRVFYALAAFPEGSSPRLKALAFGVDWDAERFVLLGSGPCGSDPFEVRDNGWPGPGTGVGMSWPATRTGLLSEVYWYAGYSYSASDTTSFALIPHPVQGGQFADDAEPPNVDEIAGYGRLGFGATGFLPCPGGSGGIVLYEGQDWEVGEGGASTPEALDGFFDGLAFVEMTSTSPGAYATVYPALENQYGLRVLVGLVPDGLFCLLDEWQRETLAVDERVSMVTTEVIPDVPGDLLPGEPGFAERVWNAIRVPPPRDSLPPFPLEGPDVMWFDPESTRTPQPFQATTTYMLGDVGMSLIFMESDSTGPCESPTYIEDWTSDELALGTANVSRGFMRLAAMAPVRGLTFTLRDTVLASTFEPIKCLPWNMSWVHEAMDQLSVQPSSNGLDRVWYLNNRMRSELGLDWWFTTFVIRDVCDPDHRFPGGFPAGGAYSIWGPGEVLAYYGGVANPDGLLNIPPHEACHVFGAPDEYRTASTCDSSLCDRLWGYLREENGNCRNCASMYDSTCVMGGMPFDFTICPFTRAHLGWRDSDGDSIPDPLDHPGSHVSMRIGDDDSLELGDFVDISRQSAWIRRLAASSGKLHRGRVLWDGVDYQGVPQSPDSDYVWTVNQIITPHLDSLLPDSVQPVVSGISLIDGECHPGSTTWCADTLALWLEDADTRSGWIRATAYPEMAGLMPARVVADRYVIDASGGDPDGKFPVTVQPGPYRVEIRIWDASGDSSVAQDSVCFGCTNAYSGMTDRLAPDPRFTLPRGRPNPTSGVVTWSLQRGTESPVSLRIFGVDGRCVRAWSKTTVPEGSTEFIWDGLDDRGARVPSGRYYLIAVDGSGQIRRTTAVVLH